VPQDEEDNLLDVESSAAEPLKFLAALMNGTDPREFSSVYTMAQIIEDDNFGDPPTEAQWEELLELIDKQCKHKPVDVGASLTAARTIAEYQHAKRKSIEVVSSSAEIAIPELTENEFDLFEAWFDDQF